MADLKKVETKSQETVEPIVSSNIEVTSNSDETVKKEPFVSKKVKVEHRATEIPKISRKFSKTRRDLIDEPVKSIENEVPTTNAEKDEEVLAEPIKKFERNHENLQLIWKNFVTKEMSQDKRALYNLMLVLAPEFDNNSLKITLQSEQQQLMFEEIRPTVLGYVNSQLLEPLESAYVHLDDSIKLGMDKPYTQSEQLDYLIEKSPVLKEAIEKLDLRLK